MLVHGITRETAATLLSPANGEWGEICNGLNLERSLQVYVSGCICAYVRIGEHACGWVLMHIHMHVEAREQPQVLFLRHLLL